MPRVARRRSKSLWPWVNREVYTAPLSVRVAAGDGVDKAGYHVCAADTAVGGAVQQVSGMVVEPVEDLGVGAVGQ